MPSVARKNSPQTPMRAPTPASDVKRAIALNDARSQDYRQRVLGSSTPLNDNSIGSSSSGESPLELASSTRSYASRQPANDVDHESFVGGGLQQSAQWAINVATAKQREMRNIQEQLTGGEAMNEEPGQRTEDLQNVQENDEQDEAPTSDEEEEYEASEAARAEELDARRQQDARDQAIRERQMARDQAEKRAYELKQKFNNLVRKSSEAGEFFSGFVDFGISDLLLLVQMNVQLIMKYFLRPVITGGNPQLAALLKGRPWFDQSNGEDFMTIWLDLVVAIIMFLVIAFCLAIIYIIIHPLDATVETIKTLIN